MKDIQCAFLCVCFCISLHAVDTALPPNGSFEDKNPSDATKASCWTGGYSVSEKSRSGLLSARCYVAEGTEPSMCDVISSLFPLKQTRNYSISGSSNGSERYVYVQQFDSTNQLITTDYWKIPESYDWRQFSFSFNTQFNAMYGRIYLRVFHTFKEAFFDDIVIAEIGQAVAPKPDYVRANQSYGKLDETLVTPHVKWAKPYCLGEIKAMVIAPTWCQRETVELSQRMSLKCTSIMTFSTVSFTDAGYLDASAKTVEDDFFMNIQSDYDIIVVGGMKWSSFPEKIRGKILDKINSGTGLVYTCVPTESLKELLSVFNNKSNSQNEIITGVPLEFMPLPAANKLEEQIVTSDYGKGKVVLLNYGRAGEWQSLTPTGFYFKEDNCLYEYFMSVLIKSCLWAANKNSGVSMSFRNTNYKFVREDSAPKLIEYKINNTTTEQKVSGKTICRDYEGGIEHETKTVCSLKKGAGTFSIEIPSLKKGKHFLDIWIVDADGKILTWGTVALEMESSLRIVDFKTDKTNYSPEENILVDLNVSIPAQPDSNVFGEVLLEDNLGNLVSHEKWKPETESKKISIKPPMPIVPLHIMKIRLSDGKGIANEQMSYLTIAKTTSCDEFRMSGWAYALDQYPALLTLKAMKDNGFSAIFEASGEIRSMSPNNYWKSLSALKMDMGFEVQGWTISPARQKEQVTWNNGFPECKEPLTDEAYKAKYKSTLDFNIKELNKLSEPGIYSLADEPCLELDIKDVCFSPSSVRDFQKWAKERYGSLAKANEVWKSCFKDWNEVRPQLFKEAEKSGDYSRWIDHRTHMEDVLLSTMIEGRNTVKAVAPETKVGFDGPISIDYPMSYVGYDWSKIMKELDYLVGYGGVTMELARSFAKEGTCLGLCTGSYGGTTESLIHMRPWETLFHGGEKLLWWTVTPTTGNGGASAFAPDLTPLPWLKDTMKELKVIQSGIDKLILNCKRSNDPIAIHYSNLCIHASTIEHELNNWTNSIESFRAVIEDAGFQYDFISTGDIESHMLKKRQFKVLILPYSQIITENEAAEIREFVNNGGLLVADINPGVRDAHGNRLDKSSLSELFSSMIEPNKKHYGKGTSFLIGSLLREYVGAKEIEGPPEIGMDVIKSESSQEAEFFIRILKVAGIKPRVRILSSNGNLVPNVEVVYYKFEDIPFYGIVPHYANFKEQAGIKLIFDTKAHLYEIISNKDMGVTDNVSIEFRPGKALLFAMLPHPAEEIHLEIADHFSPGGGIKGKIKTNNDYPLVARIELLKPDGIIIDHLTRKMILKNNASFSMPLPLNLKEGVYTIVVTEVIEGQKTSTKIEVKK